MNGVQARPWQGIAQWLEARRRRRELEDRLEAMSDRQLQDIGIRREDIGAIAGGGLPERRSFADGVSCRGLRACPHCGRNGQAA
jgi:uncharacterized protein YjiS (DUF1127 family)